MRISPDRMAKLINPLMTAFCVPPLIFKLNIQVHLPTGKMIYKRIAQHRVSSMQPGTAGVLARLPY